MASARPRIEVGHYNGGLSPSSSDGDNPDVCSCLLPDYAGGGQVASVDVFSYDMNYDKANEPEMEDITSNCLSLNCLQEAAGSSTSTSSTGLGGHLEPSTPDSPLSLSLKKKATKKVGSTSTSSVASSLSSAAAKRSKSFHTSSKHRSGGSIEAMVQAASAVPAIRLQLPEDNESKSNNEVFEMPDTETVPLPTAPPKKRKRRKSIVNLLFPGPKGDAPKTPAHLMPTPPSPSSLNTGGTGQRLHFRRLSDFICRPNTNQAKLLAASAATQSQFTDSPPESPKSPKSPESTFLGQLFPHRRRRSSVAHLDHTEQFHETKQIALEATRRRMSSFPPSDGDESAVILERIHFLSTLEGDESSRAATPVSESKSPLKLLQKHLGLPGSTSFNCSRWKSNVDVTRDQSDDDVLEKPREKPSKSKPSKSKKDKNKEDFESSNSLMPPKVRLRRNSAPLIVPPKELNALREAAERNELRDGVHVFPKRKVEDVPGIFIPQKPKKGQSKAAVSDSPSLRYDLIGHGCGAAAHAAAAADDSKGGRRNSQFLGVSHDRRRRHSISDPALFLKFNSPSEQTPSEMPTSGAASAAAAQPSRPSWLANLTPRSPYAKSSQAVLPYLPRCCCFLSPKPTPRRRRTRELNFLLCTARAAVWRRCKGAEAAAASAQLS